MSDVWDELDRSRPEAAAHLALRLVAALMRQPALREALNTELQAVAAAGRSDLGLEREMAGLARRLLDEAAAQPLGAACPSAGQGTAGGA